MPAGASSSTWPQWGTAIGGQAKDSALAHTIGSIFKAGSRAGQLAAETEAFPVRLIWFTTATQAEAYAQQAYPLAYANWQYAQNHTIPQQLQQNTGVSGLAAIGDFFSRLTQANTWLRVAEVMLGVLLLGVGVARLTGTQNAISSVVKAKIS